MWLIRAIDCSDSYRAFSSQTNIPTSLTAFESDFACSFGKALSNNGLDVFALPMLWWTHLFHYTGLPMFTKAGIPQTSISNHPSKCTQYQESPTQITSSTPSDVNLASWRLPLLGSPFVLTSLLTLLPRVWPRDVHRRGDLHQLPAQVHIHPSQLSQITLQPDIG